MRGILTIGACAALIGCATPGADVILSLDENTQASALRSCHAGLGIEGPFAPQKVALDDGRVSVFVANENGISLAEARSVNRCARDRLLATYGAGSDVFARSVPDQNAAILACKNERGVPGPFETTVFSYGSRASEVLITPAGAVTENDARAINACARAKLRGAAPAAAAASQPTLASASSAPIAARQSAAPRAPVANNPNCPRGYRGLYRGNLFCTGKR
ncbi:hypothetical protein ACOTTU_15280 [Roseobacter sp. EG26]|uniref:hypothetical protein n=1 Tax=Roseobacter sp. EG26 TaxID=3412477 RepID=UPI00260BF59A|nr:hypothetical protein [uncultured Roseobacter sp.]